MSNTIQNFKESKTYLHHQHKISEGKAWIIGAVAFFILSLGFVCVQYFGRSLDNPLLLLPGIGVDVVITLPFALWGVMLIVTHRKKISPPSLPKSPDPLMIN